MLPSHYTAPALRARFAFVTFPSVLPVRALQGGRAGAGTRAAGMSARGDVGSVRPVRPTGRQDSDSDSSSDDSSLPDDVLMSMRRRVLIVVASPDKGVSPLHLPRGVKEARKLQKILIANDHDCPEPVRGANPLLVMEQLRKAVRDRRPYRWLVFVGHGDGQNPQVDVGTSSEPQPANTPVFIGADSPTVTLMESYSLVRAIRLFGAYLELVVWNACGTDGLAKALAEAGIPNVVGWTARVADKAAAKFGKQFMERVVRNTREMAVEAYAQGRHSTSGEEFSGMVRGVVETLAKQCNGCARPRLSTAGTFARWQVPLLRSGWSVWVRCPVALHSFPAACYAVRGGAATRHTGSCCSCPCCGCTHRKAQLRAQGQR